ncbi:ferritin-like domain-containing protein [Sphingomonas bacterium]|uniref:ferritin-like domain-containing protein n=1 Tax=Sphingomonas bacterium TaxID=1895847 RepID=UPI001575CCD7|nr:ferritin-like domain-containing protein [Sphingomonas bacterium]
MSDTNYLEVLDAVERRRTERRKFLKYAGAATAAAGGLSLLAACGDDAPAPLPTPTTTPPPAQAQIDLDVLNFALNLEYVEAQFYSFAAFGSGLSPAILTGTGTQGTVTGGRQVNFTDPIVKQYALEIAADESAHVNFLRTVLGSAAVAMPAINIDGSAATGAFSQAAAAAGVVPKGGTFDPYASDEAFLLGGFIFEDVGVTAYKGASPLLVNKTYLEAAAGILATEAYHAGLLRTVLYRKGVSVPALRTIAGQISDARDSLDGAYDDDQGITRTIAGTTTIDTTVSNIVPVNGNAIAYSRNTDQVLHIVYLNGTTGAASGGFLPAGANGNIKIANANPAAYTAA